MRALLAMPETLPQRMFDPAQRERLAALADIDPSFTVADWPAAADEDLADLQIVITGWGSPQVDAAALARMPKLRGIVHTAGTVRSVVSESVWERGDIVVTSATEANAVPVAEYTLAQILLAGKRSLRLESEYRRLRDVRHTRGGVTETGNFGSIVGLIGASRIGRLVAELLRPFDIKVLISDPYVDREAIAALGATKVELPELFSRSDVVSLHAPDVPATKRMVSAELLALMRQGTTFLNTARPALVDEEALRAELVSGRLSAVLDVHDQLPADDPLWDLSTVSLTPHIAGSQGNELHRMGEQALEEIRRLAAGEPPRYPVDPSRLAITA